MLQDIVKKLLIFYLEPLGKARLKEALEANDWEAVGLDDDFDLDALDEDDEGSTGFGMEATELEMEMFGMKTAVRGTAENEDESSGEPTEEKEEDVEQLEAMMLRLQAVRGKSFGVSQNWKDYC